MPLLPESLVVVAGEGESRGGKRERERANKAETGEARKKVES